MAVEDGLVLATALRSTGLSAADVPAALAGYDAQRRPRITKLLRAAAENREVKTAGPVRRKAAELVMPFVFRHV